jgi:hypothetical protein
MTQDSITETITELLDEIKAARPDMRGCLIYSCASRIAHAGGMGHELAIIQEQIGHKNFSFAYAGGEIFPQTLENGRTVNTFQNNSLTVCVFE